MAADDNRTVNRDAVATLAQYGSADVVKGMWIQARITMQRLDMGEWDTPAALDHPVLEQVDPVGTLPSLLDVIAWMNSLFHTSDSDSESDSDDNSVSDLSFMSRLYETLDARVPPTFRAAYIAAE